MQPLSMYIAFDADGHWHAVDADDSNASNAIEGLEGSDAINNAAFVVPVTIQPFIDASGKVTLAIVQDNN